MTATGPRPIEGEPDPQGTCRPAEHGGPDIAANRRAIKWSRRELAGRAVWEALRGPLFAWTPRPMWAWRRSILRLFGATIGCQVHVHPTVRIAVPWNLSIADEATVGDCTNLYSLGPISIGKRATISQNAHLCAGTHDYRRRNMALLKPPIAIGAGAWICADAFIGPGVTVGPESIVGARAVVTKDVPSRVIVGGNPARVLAPRPAMLDT
jgi:putative colanic acid biosynthesis acetyltransferase WcaF